LRVLDAYVQRCVDGNGVAVAEHVVPGRADRRPGHDGHQRHDPVRLRRRRRCGTESFASTTANTGTGGSWAGSTSASSAGTWNANLDLDDLAADDQSSTTFLGASAASGTPVVVDPTPPPGAPSSWPPPDVYGQAIRSSVKIGWSVSAIFAGAPVDGATDLAPVGGSITDTNKPGVRRVLNVDLAPERGCRRMRCSTCSSRSARC
jgi:hypothetical protein